MKTKAILIMALLFSAYGTFAQNDEDKRVMADAEAAKAKLKKMDNGLEAFFNNASGYAIFPNVGEGGFILGAASGNGVLYENGEPVGMANLKKVDVGLQIGGQAVMEIIFFETEEALNEFKQDQFEVSAEISAVALKKGKSIHANYDDGVAIFVQPKEGLMADLSVGGQKFEFTPMEELEQ